MLEADHLLNPRLRPVEAFPVRMNNRDYVCVRDPESFAEQPMFLDRTLLFFISRMDGNHSLRDMQADFFRASGEILPLEHLESLVSQLDAQHYLTGPAFQSFHCGLVDGFRHSATRPARHAGSAYEAGREGFRSQMEGYFASTPSATQGFGTLKGLVSPHIDFGRGGPAYGRAYQALREHPGADTFVVFGTCHTPMPERFSITRKDYETPLGIVRTDRDFVARLSEKLGNCYRDDFPHRGEHSIEFQAVILQYVLEHSNYRMVPILVGSFHDLLSEGRSPADDPEICRLVDAVREAAGQSGGRVCVIAGADLAHVGRRFGDPSGPTEASLLEVGARDREFLRRAESGDAEGVFRSIAEDGDRRRVCGYPPIYMTLQCIDQPRGVLLDYRQWSDFEAGAAVTFAALAFF